MKTYALKISAYVEIEAENRNQAEEKFWTMADNTNIPFVEIDIETDKE